MNKIKLEKAFSDAIRILNIPGGIMLIKTPKGKEYTFVAGVRKLGSSSRISHKTRFRAGSITKTFVASVILMLVDDGDLTLDTSVHKILPDLIDAEDNLRVRHLLSMRSNVWNFSTDKDFLKIFRKQPWKKWSPKALLGFEPDFERPSGVSFEYNNANYVLLGMIIEKITKDTFENQVHKRILNPLGLKGTKFPTTSAKMHTPFARGYDYNPETDKVTDLSLRINPSWAWCSGNVVSTAPDLMKWIIAYLNGFGISNELIVQQMEFKPALHYGISYGLGVMNKYDAVGHNGNYAGIYTAMAFKFKEHYFVILTNGQSRGGMQDATAEAVFWRVISKSELFAK